jgi:hypothetical protein
LSSSIDVNGSGAASTRNPSAARGWITLAQLDPSAHAPWTNTTLTLERDIALASFYAKVRP